MKAITSLLLSGAVLLGVLTGCGYAGTGETLYVCTRAEDATGNYIVYDYDESGNQIKASAYSASDTLTGWTEYTYTQDGQPLETVEYDADGDRQSLIRRTYDDDGLLTEESHLDGSEAVLYTDRYTYNADGVCIKQTHTETDNNYWFDISTDSDGNEIRRVQHYTDDTDADAVTVEHLYTESGLLIKTTTWAGDAVTGWDELDYDEDGLLVSTCTYTDRGKLDVKYSYTYDKHGNLIQTDYLTAEDSGTRQTCTYQTLSEYLKQK